MSGRTERLYGTQRYLMFVFLYFFNLTLLERKILKVRNVMTLW